MRTILPILLLAGGAVISAARPAEAQVVTYYPGYGDPLVGRYWSQTGFVGPGAYTLPTYTVSQPGYFYYGYGYGLPYYGYNYGWPYATYSAYGPWSGFSGYRDYRYRSFGRGYDYGTFWGWR